MQSSLIGKIEKAKRYSQEPDRITLSELAVKFRGEHSDYDTGYKNEKWHCSCHFFATWGLCSHTMALQRILGNTLTITGSSPNIDLLAEPPSPRQMV